MMNKRMISLLGGGVVALMVNFQGYAQENVSLPKKPSKYAKITPITEERFKIARSDAEQFADDILEGIKKVDYNLFMKNMRTNFISKKNFPKQMEFFKKKRGVYVEGSRQYLGFLNRGGIYEFLWKVTLKREVKTMNGETKIIPFENLLSISVCEINKTNYVLAFNFQ